MHYYRKISVYAILVTLSLIIPGSSPSRAWEFGVKGHGYEPYRFIVISSSRMHLKGANIAANIFQIYNRYSCSICNLKLQILHQKLAAAESCTWCICSATGNVTQLIVAVFASRIFAVYILCCSQTFTTLFGVHIA